MEKTTVKCLQCHRKINPKKSSWIFELQKSAFLNNCKTAFFQKKSSGFLVG